MKTQMEGERKRGIPFPEWAEDQPGWLYIGWIKNPSTTEISFEELCENAKRIDHGELRKVVIYPQGATCWYKE